jgi:hypothetical protein
LPDSTITSTFDDDAAAQKPESDRGALTANETGVDDAVESSSQESVTEKKTVTTSDGTDEGTHTETTTHTEHR